MPYIRQIERDSVDKEIDNISTIIKDCGQLNYVITKLCHNHLIKLGLKYARINEVIGVLDCAKMELYSQIASPYEDTKKLENGNISKLDKEKP